MFTKYCLFFLFIFFFGGKYLYSQVSWGIDVQMFGNNALIKKPQEFTFINIEKQWRYGGGVGLSLFFNDYIGIKAGYLYWENSFNAEYPAQLIGGIDTLNVDLTENGTLISQGLYFQGVVVNDFIFYGLHFETELTQKYKANYKYINIQTKHEEEIIGLDYSVLADEFNPQFNAGIFVGVNIKCTDYFFISPQFSYSLNLNALFNTGIYSYQYYYNNNYYSPYYGTVSAYPAELNFKLHQFRMGITLNFNISALNRYKNKPGDTEEDRKYKEYQRRIKDLQKQK